MSLPVELIGGYIKDYYEARGLKWPSFDNAMKWAITEIAEVYELDLARESGWVRNNPEKHEGFTKERLAEELGDVIFMLLVAGITEDVDPLRAMLSKMDRKWPKPPETNDDWTQTTFTSGSVDLFDTEPE
jgi:hypothetical protein